MKQLIAQFRKESWDQLNLAGKVFVAWFGILILTVAIYTPMFFSSFKTAYPTFTQAAGVGEVMWFYAGLVYAVASLIYTVVTGQRGPWDKKVSRT